MSTDLDIAVIVGSLRRDSLTLKFANAVMALAPSSMKWRVVPIGDLPLYNPDLEEATAPSAWTDFRTRVGAADGVLFATPEYNRSIPGALKNALDVGSRPYGASVWSGKPAAIVSVSPGALGAFGANHHLRQPLVFLDMPTLQQPEMYIGHADKLLDAQGAIVDDSTRTFGLKFLTAFESWVRVNSRRGA